MTWSGRDVAALTAVPLGMGAYAAGVQLAAQVSMERLLTTGTAVPEAAPPIATALGYLGHLAGAVVASVLGPRLAAGLFATLGAAACALMVVRGPGALIVVGLLVLLFAQAAVTVALTSAAIEAWPESLRAFRVAAIAVGTAAVGVASVSARHADVGGTTALLLALACLLAPAGVAAIEALPRRPRPDDPRGRLIGSRVGLAVATTALLAAPLVAVGWEARDGPDTVWWWVAAPVVGVLWVVLQRVGLLVPPAAGPAVGLLGLASLAPFAPIAEPVGIGLVTLATVPAVVAVTDGVHRRLVPWLVAVWMSVMATPWWVWRRFLDDTMTIAMVAAGGVVALGLCAVSVLLTRAPRTSADAEPQT